MIRRSLTKRALLLVITACQREEPPLDPVQRAGDWMARFPPEKLRFDAAIGLAAILEHAHGPALRTAYNRTKEVADHDTDNPLRRAFDPTNRADKSVTAGWEIPKPGERVNVNRIVAEALHCRENGIRPEALDYATGAMRDQGG